MDVYNMYVGDCSYTPRHSVFRDYERFPYGSLERNTNPQKSYYEKVQEKLRRDNTKKPAKKEPCPFCQEQKKRPLIAYMRKMALEKQKSRICEEEENDEGHCHYDDANETEKK